MDLGVIMQHPSFPACSFAERNSPKDSTCNNNLYPWAKRIFIGTAGPCGSSLLVPKCACPSSSLAAMPLDACRPQHAWIALNAGVPQLACAGIQCPAPSHTCHQASSTLHIPGPRLHCLEHRVVCALHCIAAWLAVPCMHVAQPRLQACLPRHPRIVRPRTHASIASSMDMKPSLKAWRHVLTSQHAWAVQPVHMSPGRPWHTMLAPAPACKQRKGRLRSGGVRGAAHTASHNLYSCNMYCRGQSANDLEYAALSILVVYHSIAIVYVL